MLKRAISSTRASLAMDSYISVNSSGISTSGSKEITNLWSEARTKDKAGETRTFFKNGVITVAVSTGKDLVTATTGKGGEKEENKLKELSRRNASLAVHALKKVHSSEFAIDPLHSAHSAAVGATLATFVFNLKSTSAGKESLKPVSINLLPTESKSTLKSETATNRRIGLDWETGLIYGRAQNLARELMELPANICTPTYFCDRAKKEFSGIANVTMEAHDLKWAESKKMGSFISVNRGTAEPLRFLELHYKGAADKNEKPLALVGKGITFDSGGISIKGASNMKDMRADMGGAATTLSAVWAIASLKLPLNIVLCIPLTENMPSGTATKPGDIVVAANGVNIEVDNTDAEGRLVLADALYYASHTFKPHTIVDTATLTGAIMIALGNQFTGVYSNSDSLWSELEAAALAENDRVWRMPLDEGYMKQINGSAMDLINTGGRLAGSCTAAIFLKRFVDGLVVDGNDNEDDNNIRWAHCDIAGVMDLASGDGGYNLSGMTGRPVRTLIEFARRSIKE